MEKHGIVLLPLALGSDPHPAQPSSCPGKAWKDPSLGRDEDLRPRKGISVKTY